MAFEIVFILKDVNRCDFKAIGNTAHTLAAEPSNVSLVHVVLTSQFSLHVVKWSM